MHPLFINRLPRPLAWLIKALAALGVACPLLAVPASAPDWPSVTLPKGIETFSIGQQVVVNSMPMRMSGFVSADRADRVAESFRQSMGEPLLQNWVGNKLVLGRAEGEHYVSVQIEPAGRGTRGVVAVTHLQQGHEAREKARAENEYWLTRLPSGSRLVSQMVSLDSGKTSRHVVFINTQDEGLNQDRVKDIFAQEGLAVEHEGRPDPNDAARLGGNLAESRTLLFKGAGKEGMATIHRDANGQATTVLNIVSSADGAGR